MLLPAQMADYGVDEATIGATFFTSAAGYVIASSLTGPIVGRLGTRRMLLGFGALLLCAWLFTSTRPPFLVFVVLSLLMGFATGLLECVLNVYLTARPGSTALLNRLHAFFGVGALIGPLLAAWLLTFTGWPTVMLVLAVVTAPTLLAAAVTFPAPAADPLLTASAPPDGSTGSAAGGGGRPAAGLPAVLRQPAVLLGAGMLAVYVGLEIAVGNWGYTYLVEERSVSGLLAGYTTSGYWLGLTAGRFLTTPVTARLRLTQTGLMYACMAGTTVAGVLAWAAPGTAGLASAAFLLLGFFLGPIFPTAMAVTPRLTSAGLVPTAIGVLTAGGLVGGALLPWLAGTLLQVAGAWTLFPFAILLALAQLALWWRVARRIADTSAPSIAASPEVQITLPGP
ncbi:MFS transporter [Pseudofrankia sp. EUN1h]|nr:MFS transporter [Pseudofrankia sp. EUN1h]